MNKTSCVTCKFFLTIRKQLKNNSCVPEKCALGRPSVKDHPNAPGQMIKCLILQSHDFLMRNSATLKDIGQFHEDINIIMKINSSHLF